MRCERCNFENIPGQKTCVRCGSALEIKSAAGNVYPPWMSRWKKPFRSILRWMRIGKIVPEWDIKVVIPTSIKKHLNNNIWWLILSIIPGLGHSAQRRFKEIRWYFWAWLGLLLAGLFYHGSSTEFILLGLAIGFHAGIALQSGIIKNFDNSRNKTMMAVFVLIALVLIYRFTQQAVAHNIVGGYSGITVPYYNIETGDYLLGKRSFKRASLLQRGSLVLIHPVLSYDYNNNRHRAQETIFAEIVGISGENLRVVGDAFEINGQKLDTGRYPVPQWLRNSDISVIILDNNYFVNIPYNVETKDHGAVISDNIVYLMCMVEPNDIEAKAFLCWWPLSRRGFIKVD